jgi:LDH2 family malate/lactate/ureidoglycolate dehydrogenase
MVVKTADELHRLATSVLMAVGADASNAKRVADHQVLANLSGVDTHGVNLLPKYVAYIRAGEIVPTARPEIVSQTPTCALVSGNWTFGHVTAKFALDTAIRKAAAQNLAMVGMVQLNHIGRLGEYAELAAEQGMVALVTAAGFSEDVPMAAPYGGRARVLQTNPFCMGFPGGEGRPMVFDYATSAASGVKVENARNRNERVPLGWIVDKYGNPTTDPNDYFEGGALLPFGAHKGFALMLAAEFLGRVLTGSDAFVVPGRGGPGFSHSGGVVLVIKADLFRPLTDYGASAEELQRRVRAVPPAPGFEEVLSPGDLEARARAARRRDGIPLADDVWQSLVDLGASLGLEGT